MELIFEYGSLVKGALKVVLMLGVFVGKRGSQTPRHSATLQVSQEQPHRDPTLYRMVRFSERIHCTESVEFTGPLEPVNLDHFEYY